MTNNSKYRASKSHNLTLLTGILGLGVGDQDVIMKFGE
jgi:hypothetical protein